MMIAAYGTPKRLPHYVLK